MISIRSSIPARRTASSRIGRSARLPRGEQLGPKQRWTRYSLVRANGLVVASSTHHARGDAGLQRVANLFVVAPTDLMDVPLKGEGPVVRRPLADIGHLARHALGRDEARFLQDEIGRRLHPEGIVLLLRLLLRVAALPDDLMALEGGRGDRRDSTERLDSSHVVDDLVARLHPLCLLAVTGLDPLDRESALCGAAEVVDRADNDPVGRVTGFSGHCCLSPRRWFRPHTGASSRPGGARSKYRTRRTAGPRR